MKGGSLKVKEIKAFLEASYQENPPTEIFGYILDSELSNIYGKVYYNNEKMKLILVHRGTGELSDWSNNAIYAANTTLYKQTSRFKSSEIMTRKAIKKYPNYQVEVLGHSQGSLLARETARNKNIKNVIQLNPAYKAESIQDNEIIIRSANDIVSSSTIPKKYLNSLLYPKFTERHMITIPAKTNNPLIEHSLDVLDRLNGEKIIGKGGSIPIIPKRELPGYIINIDL